MRIPLRSGYTLVETIVALLLFSVGGLALASSAALIGRQLRVDGARERAAVVAASRIETLRASCSGATSGAEKVSGVESVWSASRAGSAVALTVSATYGGWSGLRTDTYQAVIPCH